MKNRIAAWLVWVSVIICAAFFAGVCFAAEENAAASHIVSIPAEITVEGDPPEKAETFIIRMIPSEENYPMPEGSTKDGYDLKITGQGTASFPNLEFGKMGVYQYTVRQTGKTGMKKAVLDKTVYTLTVYVTKEEQGNGLDLTAVLEQEGKTAKPDCCRFVNTYPRQESETKGRTPGQKIPAETPKGNPKTGDPDRPVLWLMMLLLSGMFIAYARRTRSRERN